MPTVGARLHFYSGAFFHPPAETWSGSDTTDGSTSAGVVSGGEGIDGDFRAVVVSTVRVSLCRVVGRVQSKGAALIVVCASY